MAREEGIAAKAAIIDTLPVQENGQPQSVQTEMGAASENVPSVFLSEARGKNCGGNSMYI